LLNTGLYESAKARKIRAIFVGHDHRNDYGGFLGNVELIYGRKTGFGYPGPTSDVIRGGRLITIKEMYNYGLSQKLLFLDHKIILGDGNFIENG